MGVKYKFKISGYNWVKKPFYGSCVAESFAEVLDLAMNFGLSLTTVKQTVATSALPVGITKLIEGTEPEPFTRCMDCIYMEKKYRETAGNDIEVYNCTRYSFAMSPTAYCSEGKPKAKEEENNTL